MNDMETVVKGLQIGLQETQRDVKEMQAAMVGSIDGTKKGFGQQLLAVMKEMEGFASRMLNVENKLIRYEGAFGGAKLAIVASASLVSFGVGIAVALLVKK